MRNLTGPRIQFSSVHVYLVPAVLTYLYPFKNLARTRRLLLFSLGGGRYSAMISQSALSPLDVHCTPAVGPSFLIFTQDGLIRREELGHMET